MCVCVSVYLLACCVLCVCARAARYLSPCLLHCVINKTHLSTHMERDISCPAPPLPFYTGIAPPSLPPSPPPSPSPSPTLPRSLSLSPSLSLLYRVYPSVVKCGPVAARVPNRCDLSVFRIVAISECSESLRSLNALFARARAYGASAGDRLPPPPPPPAAARQMMKIGGGGAFACACACACARANVCVRYRSRGHTREASQTCPARPATQTYTHALAPSLPLESNEV